VLTNTVTSALDRTQNSNRFSAHIVKATVASTLKAAADALGLEEIAELKVKCSQTTVKSTREKNRVEVVAAAKEALAKEPGPFLLQWDGKLLPDDPGGNDGRHFS